MSKVRTCPKDHHQIACRIPLALYEKLKAANPTGNLTQEITWRLEATFALDIKATLKYTIKNAT